MKFVRRAVTREWAFSRNQHGRREAVSNGVTPPSEALAIRVRMRAERRAGELLRELSRSETRGGGDRRSAKARDQSSNGVTNDPPSEHAAALARTGVSRQTAHRWQQLARVPADDFERQIGVTRDQSSQWQRLAALLGSAVGSCSKGRYSRGGPYRVCGAVLRLGEPVASHATTARTRAALLSSRRRRRVKCDRRALVGWWPAIACAAFRESAARAKTPTAGGRRPARRSNVLKGRGRHHAPSAAPGNCSRSCKRQRKPRPRLKAGTRKRALCHRQRRPMAAPIARRSSRPGSPRALRSAGSSSPRCRPAFPLLPRPPFSGSGKIIATAIARWPFARCRPMAYTSA